MIGYVLKIEKDTPDSRCLNPSYEKKMCARFVRASDRESRDVIADFRKDQSTNIAAMATYATVRVHIWRVIDMPIFFTNIGYRLSSDSETSFDMTGINIVNRNIYFCLYISNGVKTFGSVWSFW